MAERPDVEMMIDTVRKGDLDRLEQLLAAGARINDATPEGNTALMYACTKGKEPVIRRLMAAGANPNHVNKFGKTAFDWAKWAPDASTVRSMLTNH